MKIKLSNIINVLDKESLLIEDGYFNSLSLLNGSLKKDNNSLSYIEDEKYIDELLGNKEISCIICLESMLDSIQEQFNGGIISSKMPRTDFFIIHNYLSKKTNIYGIEYETEIDSSAEIDDRAIISKKNVRIGKNTKIMANAIIKENTIIGDNVIIREGAIIGNPAFYYYKCNKNNEAVESTGGVVIGNNVEIHSNVIISKGVLGGNTEIGNYTKIDCNTSIAHDSKIRENCIITAGISIAGVVTVGNNTFIGIGANIVPMVKIGENCKISSGSVVTKDVEDNTHVSGNFAIPHNRFINFIKGINKENTK